MTMLYFDRREFDPILRWARAHRAPVSLVHDNGVYLMAETQPCQPDDRPGRPPCRSAYAEGLGPDDYNEAREAVGGDDFVARIPTAEFTHETGPRVRVHFQRDGFVAHTVDHLNREFSRKGYVGRPRRRRR